MEYFFRRSSAGGDHVAWNDAPNWSSHPDFVAHVRKAASADRPIVLICRGGNRLMDAGAAQEEAGFTKVHNVLHGFVGDLDENRQRYSRNGWRVEGLPWEQC
jgi:rhodanese-related sulfurtransferase